MDCFVLHNDGARVSSLREYIIIIKQNKMTGFINSNRVINILTYCNSLDCFVPRNDGARVSSLRACEAIQKKQHTKTLHKLVIAGNKAIQIQITCLH